AGRDASAEPRRRSSARVAFRRLPGLTTGTAFGPLGSKGLSRWKREVPRVEDVRVRSSRDGSRQRALWVPPPRGAGGDRPLLVVLHSWSTPYTQHLGIPYADWARRNGWAMIAPNFRGINTTAQAAGSELAVQDVVDAIDYAGDRGRVDERRVYVVGFSGGGMMSLLVAGRHPDRIAGAAAWVPVHDLSDWHRYNAEQDPRRDYADHIEAACGGDPARSPDARRECNRRSPRTYLDAARRARVPVYIGHGLDDTLVRPSHALRAFNQLANEDDRIGRRSLRRVKNNALPDHLRGARDAPTHFGRQDPDVLFSRRSGSTTLAIFEGEHDLVFNPALRWMARIDAGDER
ncbi:MAG: alpha/beta fold hydrolase, partial [Actinomycetota bacterium]|nr:alpha/beta fold hydrolase [Actinomycetota bacterium]